MLPLFMWLTYRVGKVRRRLAAQTQASLADITAITEETVSVSGILLTKTFGQQQAAIDRYRDANAKLAALQIRQSMVGRWFFMIVGTVFSITPALVYFLAGYLAITGAQSAPTIGDIVAFTTLQSRLFFPLGQLLNVQVEAQGALALFDRIFEYLDLPVEIADAPGRRRPVAGFGARTASASATSSFATGASHARLPAQPIRTARSLSQRTSRRRSSGADRRWRNAGRRAPAVRFDRRRLRGQARTARGVGRAVGVGQDDRRLICCRGCTTWMRARSRSTATMCAT